MNLGPLPTANGLTRLESRLHRDPESLESTKQAAGRDLKAAEAADLIEECGKTEQFLSEVVL